MIWLSCLDATHLSLDAFWVMASMYLKNMFSVGFVLIIRLFCELFGASKICSSSLNQLGVFLLGLRSGLVISVQLSNLVLRVLSH